MRLLTFIFLLFASVCSAQVPAVGIFLTPRNTTELDTTCVKYGLLYNWYAANGDIAPSGWHVPTRAEYQSLATYLGGNSIAGGKLKEAGITRWNTPNTGADNSSGFTGVGGGYRNGINGNFTSMKAYSGYITSTAIGGNYYFVFELKYDSNASTDNAATEFKFGSPIKLIKDDSDDPGQMVDYDGNVYNTVKIGNQVWMAQNLMVTHYNDGTPIPNVTDNSSWAALSTGACCAYDNDVTNVGCDFEWPQPICEIGYNYSITFFYACDYDMSRDKCDSAGGGSFVNQYKLTVGKYYYYGNISGIEIIARIDAFNYCDGSYSKSILDSSKKDNCIDVDCPD